MREISVVAAAAAASGDVMTSHQSIPFRPITVGQRPERGIKDESRVRWFHSGTRDDRRQTDAGLIASSHSLTFGFSVHTAIASDAEEFDRSLTYAL